MPLEEPRYQMEYIPSRTDIVHHTIVTTKKTIVSQKKINIGAPPLPLVVGMSSQLIQAATEQPYTVESSSVDLEAGLSFSGRSMPNTTSTSSSARSMKHSGSSSPPGRLI